MEKRQSIATRIAAPKQLPVVTNRASARTRKKILAASIDLFNKHGIQNITVERIATEIGISSGNLNYHFRRKHNLVMEIMVVMEERMREVLSPKLEAKEPRSGVEYLIDILHTFWDFRFLFNALTYLLSKDKDLRKEYFRFQDWAFDTIEHGFEELMRKGDFRAIRAPNTTRLLAENVWYQWLSWLRIQQIKSPTAVRPQKQALYECALLHWSLLEPYYSEKFADDLLPLYRSLLLKEKRG